MVRNLGIYFGLCIATPKACVFSYKCMFYHIRDLCSIKHYIDNSALLPLANALVCSRLDYCNSLFQTITKKDKTCLQHVLNTVSRVVTGVSRYRSTTPILKYLHCLPIVFQIKFKSCVVIYKALNTGYPRYLSSCLQS